MKNVRYRCKRLADWSSTSLFVHPANGLAVNSCPLNKVRCTSKLRKRTSFLRAQTVCYSVPGKGWSMAIRSIATCHPFADLTFSSSRIR